MKPTILFFGCALLGLNSGTSWASAPVVEVARESRALLPVSVPKQASNETRQLAKEISELLGRMTGGTFAVAESVSAPAIHLGLRKDFPDLFNGIAEPTWTAERERYRIVTRDGSLWIVGESELGLQNGVYGLLHELGYRQYYPTPTWEFVPKKPSLSVAFDKTEQPAFGVRKFFQPAPRKSDQEALSDWERKNRMISGLKLNTVGLLRPRGKVSKEHPEWFSKPGHKPIVDQEGFAPLLLEDAIEQAGKPGVDTVGLSPSDGGGWPEESAIGTPSDRMAYLANYIMRGFREQGIEKKVAFLAYHMQAPPPSIDLEKDGAIVLIATSYIRGGDFTPVQLIEGWKKRHADVGVYEYLDNTKFHWNLPGHALAAQLSRVDKVTRDYAAAGARYWLGETSGGWASNGLGYYLTSRILWNPATTDTPESVMREMVANCFGAAQAEMMEYYGYLDGTSKSLLSEDLFARMYSALKSALGKENDAIVQKRIFQLVAYTHYAEMVYRYRSSSGEEKLDAFSKLRRLLFACREIPMFEYRILNRLPEMPPEDRKKVRSRVPVDLPPTLTDAEAMEMLDAGLQKNKRLTFTPQRYSNSLVPFNPSNQTKTAPKNLRFSRTQQIYWLAPKPGSPLKLKINSGWRPYGQKLPVKVSIELVDDPLADVEGADIIADRGEVPCDQQWHEITLRSKEAGLHYVTINDGFNETEVEWPAGEKMTVSSSPEESTYLRGTYDAVFLVPAGVDRIAGYSEGRAGKIVADTGDLIVKFNTLPGSEYFDIPIIPSKKPRIFRLEAASGKKLLMTVPPYLARSEEELLVPKECLLKMP